MSKGNCKAYAHNTVYNGDEEEFIGAVQAYKQQHQVRFPSLCELLMVLKLLGYRKVNDEPGDAGSEAGSSNRGRGVS